MGNRKSARINWDALFIEFLKSPLTRGEFCKLHGLATKHFYDKSAGWDEERRRLVEKAVDTVKQEIGFDYEQLIRQQSKLWQMIHVQAMAINRACMDADQKAIARPLTPGELSQLANALDTTLKAIRLIAGKSTAINEEHVNVHETLVDTLAELQKNAIDGDIIPPQEPQA